MVLTAASRTSVSGSRTRLLGALLLAVAGLAISPIGALAHPLGNFTINHFAGIRVAGDAISLDVVIDQAEIPTVAERQRIDVDGDGTISRSEMERERQSVCARLSEALTLTVGGQPLDLSVTAAGLSFPVGAAGLATFRTVCEYRATLDRPVTAGTVVQFADHSTPDRIGWREIVVSGDGITIGSDGAPVPSLVSSQPSVSDSVAPAGTATDPAAGVSRRLTSYPASLLAAPLAMTDTTFTVSPGGPSVGSPCIPDAFPLSSAPGATNRGYGCEPLPVGQQSGVAAAVPGGVGTEISALLSTTELTLPVLILSLLTAMALGAAHALTPGHGKTLMAAYLVGTRGTARHALALGLTVTVSHTLGVLALAGVILALHIVTPESFTHVTGILSGLVVISIGGWLFVRQGLPMIRTYLAARSGERAAPHHHDDHHSHADPRPRGAVISQAHETVTADAHEGSMVHSHGGIAHRHAPSTSEPMTWRSLFALGLFGGLVPSINALIILLATLAVGRAAYGVVLVVAFGAGMAIVLGGIGLGLVYASRWMERTPRSSVFNRVVAWAPAVTSITILAVGLYVTTAAIAGSPVL